MYVILYICCVYFKNICKDIYVTLVIEIIFLFIFKNNCNNINCNVTYCCVLLIWFDIENKDDSIYKAKLNIMHRYIITNNANDKVFNHIQNYFIIHQNEKNGIIYRFDTPLLKKLK